MQYVNDPHQKDPIWLLCKERANIYQGMGGKYGCEGDIQDARGGEWRRKILKCSGYVERLVG